MNKKIAVIGVGNMARAIINGVLSSDVDVDRFFVYDKNDGAYSLLQPSDKIAVANSIREAIADADCVLLSVKPQNFPDVLGEIGNVKDHEIKLYITIAAGITSKSVSEALGGAVVVRVLPNLPMTIGKGISAICKNPAACDNDIEFVNNVFASAGSTVMIDESEMNRIIGVTSSSPAYVFKFINAICKGAEAQGLDGKALIETVCDMVIGSAELLKASDCSPEELMSRVASKGGTTEQALLCLDEKGFDEAISEAMLRCTKRADELGK